MNFGNIAAQGYSTTDDAKGLSNALESLADFHSRLSIANLRLKASNCRFARELNQKDPSPDNSVNTLTLNPTHAENLNFLRDDLETLENLLTSLENYI